MGFDCKYCNEREIWQLESYTEKNVCLECAIKWYGAKTDKRDLEAYERYCKFNPNHPRINVEYYTKPISLWCILI